MYRKNTEDALPAIGYSLFLPLLWFAIVYILESFISKKWNVFSYIGYSDYSILHNVALVYLNTCYFIIIMVIFGGLFFGLLAVIGEKSEDAPFIRLIAFLISISMPLLGIIGSIINSKNIDIIEIYIFIIWGGIALIFSYFFLFYDGSNSLSNIKIYKEPKKVQEEDIQQWENRKRLNKIFSYIVLPITNSCVHLYLSIGTSNSLIGVFLYSLFMQYVCFFVVIYRFTITPVLFGWLFCVIYPNKENNTKWNIYRKLHNLFANLPKNVGDFLLGCFFESLPALILLFIVWLMYKCSN